MSLLSLEKLKEVLEYNPETGVWTWLRPDMMNKKPISAVAGTISVHGYRIITYAGVKYRSSRLAYFYMTGKWPDEEMDHRDRDKTNDRWNNLRVVSRSDNALNRDLQINNTSGARGVHWDTNKGKWAVQVKSDNVTYHFGRYDDLDEAIEARDAAALIMQGSLATLNRDPYRQENMYDYRRFPTV